MFAYQKAIAQKASGSNYLTFIIEMRVIIQRVKSSSVKVDGEIVGKIGRGLNLLVAIAATDTEAELDWMIRKCLELRLFPDDAINKPWSKSVIDIQEEILVISQFTLYGDCRKGRRPSFSGSAAPDIAEPLLDAVAHGGKPRRVLSGKLHADEASFVTQKPPSQDRAASLYDLFVTKLKQSGLNIATGKFGATIEVDIVNDGPVTLILERESNY